MDEVCETKFVDYKETADEVCEKVLSYIREDTSGWKVVKRTKHISVLAKPSGDFCGTLYRAEARIEVPAEKLFPFMYLPEYREKWDKAVQSYRLVETIDQDTFIFHSITHSYGFGMVSPRDFVYLLHVRKYEGDLMTTNSVSVDHPDCPQSSIYVRGSSFPSGYACCPHPENPGHSKLVAIVQVDLGGRLMPSLIESVMPTTLLNLVTDCKAGIKALKGKLP
uniref:StAR-related lipid transfer protein 6 n=1 Tax=Pogona vitticeps TaxID=103695 RepID=A0ABM5FUG2_9SAUR